MKNQQNYDGVSRILEHPKISRRAKLAFKLVLKHPGRYDEGQLIRRIEVGRAVRRSKAEEGFNIACSLGLIWMNSATETYHPFGSFFSETLQRYRQE